MLDASRAAAQVGQAESQVASSEANLALANDTLKRTEALVLTKSIPEAQAEQARQQVAMAKAQLDGALASTRLAKSGAGLHSISAPFPASSRRRRPASARSSPPAFRWCTSRTRRAFA